MRISDWSSDVCSSDLPGIRERLLKIWTDPESLNPARRTAEVTRDIAALLARLSTALETRLIRALPANLPAQQAVQHRHAIAEKVRSEERRGGKKCVSPCRSRWLPYH